ncbi:hypothetical protein GCM10011321_15080 [Youhaiella tibetensis]|uniref:Uncharacterized protein n=1 Tax=Paradevosia tibetensis TaxID=1447062 RepID=A0A5B9DN97_9HYPH|nr:hypothetical protein [Youhaiella tibetensis]QEE20385.1 hypothetical protein FNA67_09445 [Youhaiella tibetensis]GGF24658.1 hypothetical protein GCM10011321_15080 [Youhaiella tibetensis]
MTKLITPETISFRATVTEDEIRERMAHEVLDQIGGIGPDGKPFPGIRVKVGRGTGRGGGYTIDVSGPAPARIYLPKSNG